jgi:phospholipase C
MRKSCSITIPLLVLGAAACGTTAGNTSVTCAPLTTDGNTKPTADWQGTVFTIVMENHSYSQIIGNTAEAPFVNQLASQNAVAAGYHDDYVHPSEPNYLWMAAGENFGKLSDDDPIVNHVASKSHIADQLELAGLSWKSYQEDMGAPCGLQSKYPYATKHNPFVYFDDINGWDGTKFAPTARCQEHVVDYTQLDADLKANKVPRYAFISPNMVHDMHDGSTVDGDRWLQQEVPKILASDAFNKGGVLFILWDEGSLQGDDPPFLAISPNAKRGYVSHVSYDTSSYLKTVQTILGLQQLPCASAQAQGAQVMSDLFTVPLSAQPATPVAGGAATATSSAATGAATTAPAATAPAATAPAATAPAATAPAATPATGATP